MEQLASAVFSGKESEVNALLSSLQHTSFDVNQRVDVIQSGKEGVSTLILVAAERSNVRSIRRVLDCRGASLGISEGTSPLHVACENSWIGNVEDILSRVPFRPLHLRALQATDKRPSTLRQRLASFTLASLACLLAEELM